MHIMDQMRKESKIDVMQKNGGGYVSLPHLYSLCTQDTHLIIMTDCVAYRTLP